MRQGQPVNAHSHLISFVVGNSEAVPIHEGKLTIGQVRRGEGNNV